MADLIIDPWSGFDHKDLSNIGKLPGYLDEDTHRRISAYRVIDAYRETVGRTLLPDTAQHKETELQEHGDAAVLIERVATAVLGEDPQLVIAGADVQVPDEPDLPDEPEEPKLDGLDPRIAQVKQRKFDAVVSRWVEQSQMILDGWDELNVTTPALLARQKWIREWAGKDRLMGRLQENEVENVVGLGDGVIEVGWDSKNGRVKTEMHEPETYVPVLNNSSPSSFPDTVHLVWEFPFTLDNGDEEERVRRVTYRMVPIEEVEAFTPALYLAEGQTQTHVCLHTDATWLAEDFDDVYNPTKNPIFYEPLGVGMGEGEGAELVELKDYVTGYDFIPVVHIPNTLSTKHHFGRSLIARVAQLLDEIAASDTDESLSTRWAARPPMVIDGLPGGTTTVDMTPGAAVGGKSVHTVELARNLATIIERGQFLQKRLSVNSGVTDGLRGRVDASEVPSGLALTLSFTPFVQLIMRLREARSAKYPLLLKFVQRIAIQNQDVSGIDSDVVMDAAIQYGAFMPQDLLGVSEIVSRLHAAGLISTETAVLELQGAGLGVEDLKAEIASIRARDGETALSIAEATGSSQAAADYLGLDITVDEAGVDPDGAVVPPEGALVGAGV